MKETHHPNPDKTLFDMLTSHDEECGKKGISRDELAVMFSELYRMCQDLADDIMSEI